MTTVTRTYDYDARAFDPAIARTMTGLDYMRGVLRGDFPGAPIAGTLGFTLSEVEAGRAVFTGTPDRFVYNPLGTVHGGYAATLLDSAMGCAVHSTLPAGVGYTTLEFKVNFARAITGDTGRVVCEGTLIHRGRTVATAEGRVIAEDTGKLLAHGTTTCLLFGTNGN